MFTRISVSNVEKLLTYSSSDIHVPFWCSAASSCCHTSALYFDLIHLLRVISQTQDVIQAPVDTEGTMKGFCSQTCLTSFNYKMLVSTKLSIVPVGAHSQCSMCGRYSIVSCKTSNLHFTYKTFMCLWFVLLQSKYERVHQNVVQKMCSQPCFLRFCNLSKMPVCENCNSRCSKALVLRVDDGHKKLCGEECLTQFKEVFLLK